MLQAVRRMNDMDVRDPRQTLDYRGGTYRNLLREFFCLPLVDPVPEGEEPPYEVAVVWCGD